MNEPQIAIDKLERERLALKTTFVFNLLATSIASGEVQPDCNKRRLSDFLQNTCVPVQEIHAYPNYF